MIHAATIHTAERVTLADGRAFTGLNAETDAARALIAAGVDPGDRLFFTWADGRPSTHGTVGAYARWRLGDDSRQLWRPHPMAETPPRLVEWAAKIRSERRPLPYTTPGPRNAASGDPGARLNAWRYA